MSTTTTSATTATTATTDAAKTSTRNFKHNSDIESFYRFVHENGLRREASLILRRVYDTMNVKKKRKPRKKSKKTLQ